MIEKLKKEKLTKAEITLLKSIIDDDKPLTEKEVEAAFAAQNKVHKAICFHRRSWKVDSMGGGSLWTVNKKDAEKRYAETKKANKHTALIELYRGDENVLEQHQPKKADKKPVEAK
tara:strand:+ start:700 stop:1047 length:348 start_codon:yes stop_codon:yes gene_type:complete